MARVLGDIDCSTVPFTLLKTDPRCATGDLPERGIFVEPCHSASCWREKSHKPRTLGGLKPLNEGL